MKDFVITHDYVNDGIWYIYYKVTTEKDGKSFELCKVVDIDELNVEGLSPESFVEEDVIQVIQTLDHIPEEKELCLEYQMLVDRYLDSSNCCATIDTVEDLQEFLEDYSFEGTYLQYLDWLSRLVVIRDCIEVDLSMKDPLITIYPAILETFKTEL